MNQVKVGIVLSYINLIFGNLLPLIFTPIMLGLLGQNEYGLYKLSSGITSYLCLISMGIGSAVSRYLIKANIEGGKRAEENMFGMFLIIFRIIAIISVLAGCVLVMNLGVWYSASLNSDELCRMKILVFIMVLNTAVSFILSPYISIVTSHEKFRFYQCINILTTCCVPIFNIVVLYLGYKSIGMAITSLSFVVLTRFLYFVYIRRVLDFKPRYDNLPKSIVKEIFVFSFWVFVGNIVGQLYNSTDILLIGAVPALATVGVAVYNIGGIFNGMIISLSTNITNILTPRVNKMVFSNVTDSELTDYAIQVGRLQGYIIMLLVCGFIVFGRQFIHFYVGDAYSDAYEVALWIMIPYIIPLVQSLCLSVVFAKNQHKYRSILYLVIAILNVIGTWIVLPSYGIVGAAAMSGFAMLLGQGIVMNWFYQKKMGIDILRFWRSFLYIGGLNVILCVSFFIVSLNCNFYNPLNLLLGIFAYVLLYIVLNWKICFNAYEKQLVVTLFGKIIRK